MHGVGANSPPESQGLTGLSALRFPCQSTGKSLSANLVLSSLERRGRRELAATYIALVDSLLVHM